MQRYNFFAKYAKMAAKKIIFFCIFCENGSYSGDLCYSISAKSSNFAVEMKKM